MKVKKCAYILLFLLLIPQIVFTHSIWIEATPQDGEILTNPPKHVLFKMIGHLQAQDSNVEVFDGDGNKISKKAEFSETEEHTTIKVEFINVLKPDVYTVKWNFENRDEHKQKGQKGSYTFTVK